MTQPQRLLAALATLLPALLLSPSVCAADAADPIPFVWLGAVTDSSFVLHADIAPDVAAVVLSTSPDLSPVVATRDPAAANASVGDPAVYGRLRRFLFTSLEPSTHYHIGTTTSAVDGDGGSAPVKLASVHTFPREGDPSDVTIALGSCQFRAGWDASLHSIHRRFERHVAQSSAPFFMLHTGDLHYSDIATDDVRRFERATRAVLTSRRAHTLFSAVPVSYVYDDHDFGPNNADFTSPSRPAAMKHYRAMVPAPTLAAAEGAYHAYTVGRVRVLVSDTRAFADETEGSTLGTAQRAWLDDELARAGEYAVVVWLSSKPWIGGAEAGRDSWAGYGAERAEIAAVVRDKDVTNLVMVSGDAHMLAADNGSNADYAPDGGGGGFPVFQAAPLANVGTSKGGPYSEGCVGFRLFPNAQFGELRISRTADDDADGPCVEFRGFRAGDERDAEVMSFRKCGRLSAVSGSPGGERYCALPYLPAWMWVVLSVIILWACSMTASMCLAWCVWRQGKRIADDDVDVGTEGDQLDLSDKDR